MIHKEDRRNRIMQLVQQSDDQQIVGTRQLAERFGVSEMTIRRDLEKLAQAGQVRRQHGGAAAAQPKQDAPRKDVGILLVSRTGRYTDPFFNAVLEGVDHRLQELGYRIAYINTRAEVSTAEQARELLESRAVSGIILVGPPLSPESIEYLKANMRALVGTIEPIGAAFDTIAFDGYSGIRQMVDHLVRLGRRRLGFIAGNYDARQQGFVDALAAHGLPADADLCVDVPFGIDGWTQQLGHAGAAHLMSLPRPPDALVCASDLIATGAIQWLHQHNLRVPDDVAVTGFDNIAESAFTTPSLTTVHVHKGLMGELAAERVVRRIENADEVPLFIQTPVHLVIRDSCGAPQAAKTPLASGTSSR